MNAPQLPRSTGTLFSPGIGALVVSSMFFSLGGVFIKLSGETLPFMEILWVRSLISMVASAVILRKAGVSIWGNNRKVLMLRGVIGLATMALFFRALVKLPLGEATVLFFTNPVWVALLSVVILGERLNWRLGVAIVLSLVGVVLVGKPGALFAGAQSLNQTDVLLALLAAFCASAVMITLRICMRTENPYTPIIYLSGVSLLGSTFFAVPQWVAPTALEWVYMLAAGSFIQLGQVFMNKGYALVPAGPASAVGYLQIVFNGFWAAMIFAQAPDGWDYVGAVLVFLGFWLTSRGK